jgi:hypothetical protein|tara:strand:- start:109 stop:381 length:273 start_codon:yes stop_codon:yes gene_type:complete
VVNKFISKSGKEYNLDKSKMLTDKKSFIGKCIHTFKCMFNPGGKDCVKLGKDELNAMTKAQLELVGRDNGIELDKRKTKKALVEELYEVL